MKYIDADKLKTGITKERKKIEGMFVEGDNTFWDGQDDAYCYTLALIDSLQQEQKEVDLNGEITCFLSNATKMNKGEWRGKYPIGEIGFRAVARHFYELGLRRAAEMYDEIEYNRQRANEEFSEKVCQ
jgi:hypothetical protein